MLDISKKTPTLRTAVAEAVLTLKPETLERVKRGDTPKGNALEVARVAAIMAAKDTSRIIPFCHPLPVDHVEVAFDLREHSVIITTAVRAVYRTGVEMEALTAASVAALTLYDMLKMLDDTMEIKHIRLVEKRGGKSSFHDRYDVPLRAAVLVLSDSIAAGKKEDTSGRMMVDRLKSEGFELSEYQVIPDDLNAIVDAVRHYADDLKLDLVLTTGGTGFSPRDTTPEAMVKVIEREIPGIPEALRAYGQIRTPYSMLSRGKAGVRGRTIIVNLPGSRRGVAESLDALFPGLMHAFSMLWGGDHPETPRGSKK
jgi:cyclic pyranopterin phosphate synthase